VFPEGTTNDGRGLKPFKPSLFHLAESWSGQEPLLVQPVSIRYEQVNGEPLEGERWDDVAWYGDDGFIPHLLRVAALREIRVTVHCHAPLTLAHGEGRKQLASRTKDVILSQLPQTQDDAKIA
jgi:1-acyl-sn-glycerol-3-phosphate acyltransferase